MSLLVFPLQDGDTFFYLALGRYFFNHGSFPETDIYSYLSKNWQILHEWGSYLIFYSVYLIGDYAGLILFKTFSWLGIFVTLIKYSQKHKLNVIFCNLILLLTIVACSHRFSERASLFSEIFSVLILFWLVNSSNVLDKRFYSMPVIFLVWVNVHPGYVIGLMVFTWFLVFHLFDYYRSRRRDAVLSKPLIFSYLFSIVALCVNPKFVDGALYPIKTVLKPSWALYKLFNYEWMPTFNSRFVETFEVKFLIGLILVSFFLLIRNFKIYKWQFILYFGLHAGFIILISIASRFMTTGSLGLCILSLKYLNDNNIKNPQFFKSKYTWEQVFLTSFCICQILVVGTILNDGYMSSAGPRKFEFGVDSNVFPVEAIKFVEEKKIKGRFFNEYEWGGYLIWKLDLPNSIFIHGHIDDPNLLVYEYLAMNSDSEKFDQTVKKFEIKYFLLDKIKLLNPNASKLLSQLDKYSLVFSDSNSVLIQIN